MRLVSESLCWSIKALLRISDVETVFVARALLIMSALSVIFLPFFLSFDLLPQVSALFKDASLANSVEIIVTHVTIGQRGLARPVRHDFIFTCRLTSYLLPSTQHRQPIE